MALGFSTQDDNRGGRGRRSNNGRQNLHLGVVEVSDFRRNMVIAFVAVAVFGPLIWMLMDRDPPYTFQQVTIEPQEVEPGQDIFVTFQVKPQRPAPCNPGLVYRELKEESGKLHVFDPVSRRVYPEMSNNQFTRILHIPSNISPGKTYYRGNVCYTCNPLREWLRWPVCVQTPEVEFMVVK